MGKPIGIALFVFGLFMLSLGGAVAKLEVVADGGNSITYIYNEPTTITSYDYDAKCSDQRYGYGCGYTIIRTPTTSQSHSVNYIADVSISDTYSGGDESKTIDLIYSDTGKVVGTVILNSNKASNGASLSVTYTDFDGITYISGITRTLGIDGKASVTSYTGDMDTLPISWGSDQTLGLAPFGGYSAKYGYDLATATWNIRIGFPDLVDKDDDGFHVGLDKDDTDRFVTTDSDEINKIRLYMISVELIAQLQDEAGLLQDEINTLKSARDDLLNTVYNLNVDIAELRREIADSISELEGFGLILAGLVAGITDDIAQIRETHDRISQISTETLDLTVQTIPLVDSLIESRQGDIESLTLGITSADNIAQNLESVSFEGEAEASRVASLNFAIQVNETFTEQLEKAELELQILQEIKSNLEQSKTLQTELIAENINLANEIIALEGKVGKLNLTVEQQAAELNNVKTLNERQGVLITEQQEALDELEMTNAELDAKIAELEANRNRVIQEYERLVELLGGMDKFKAQFGGLLSIIGLISSVGGVVIFFKG